MDGFATGCGYMLRLTILAAFIVQSSNAIATITSSSQAVASTGDSQIIIRGSGFLADNNKGCKINWMEGAADKGTTLTLSTAVTETDTEIVCEWSDADKQQINFIKDLRSFGGNTAKLPIDIIYTSDGKKVASSTKAFMFVAADYNGILTSSVSYGAVGGTTEVKLSFLQHPVALVESADAKCRVMVSPFNVYTATFNSDDDTYTCEFTYKDDISNNPALLDDTAAEEKILYQLTLSGDTAEMVGDSTDLDFSFVMPGPQVLDVVPMRGGTVLMLTWDYPVMTDASPPADLPTCAEIFDTDSTDLFGSGATCTWPTEQQIAINLGIGSTVKFGTSTLGIEGDIFYRTQKTLSESIIKTATTSVSVGPLDAEPLVTIVGPHSLTFCNNVLTGFDASADDVAFQPRVQGNVGPNELDYSWSIT